MAQISVLKFQVDIKSSPERFYKTLRTKPTMLSKMCPSIVKDIQLVKGDWDSLGSVKKWTLVPTDNSSPEATSFLTEAMDEKNKSITMKVVDGDMTKLYSLYRFTAQIVGKGNEGSGSSVNITLEYEKKNEHVPEPTIYFEFATAFYKSIDAYLLNNM